MTPTESASSAQIPRKTQPEQYDPVILGDGIDARQVDVFPAILAPIGYSHLMHPEGECAASSGAGEAGTAFIPSTISGHSLKDVRVKSKGPLWYQLHLLGGLAAADAAW